MKTQKSILIVDDDKMLATILQDSLKEQGHKVLRCHNGIDAMEYAEKQSFDVFLVDYYMPGMTGGEFAKAARDRFGDSLIIGYSGRKVKHEFMKAGANVFLQKPFDFSELLSLINLR
ncbi:MAG TPA: response regulator [Nitrospirota bacterium]